MIRSRSNSIAVSAPCCFEQREGDRALARADLDQVDRPACGLTASTILSMTLRSCRKCWPRCFFGGSLKWLMRACPRVAPAARTGVDRGDQARRIGAARAGDFQRGAVVDRDARVGQAERDVHRLLEAGVLEHRQALVVVHRQHRIEAGAASAAGRRYRPAAGRSACMPSRAQGCEHRFDDRRFPHRRARPLRRHAD